MLIHAVLSQYEVKRSWVCVLPSPSLPRAWADASPPEVPQHVKLLDTQHCSLAWDYCNSMFPSPESRVLEAVPTIPTPQPLWELGYKHGYVHWWDLPALGVFTGLLKLRDSRAVGGQWECSDEQVNFPINSAVFAIKDSARPCITTDITDIKHCIRRGCNGLSWTLPPATGDRQKWNETLCLCRGESATAPKRLTWKGRGFYAPTQRCRVMKHNHKYETTLMTKLHLQLSDSFCAKTTDNSIPVSQKGLHLKSSGQIQLSHFFFLSLSLLFFFSPLRKYLPL